MAKLEDVKRDDARLRQRLTSNSTSPDAVQVRSAKAVQARSVDAARMVYVWAATGTARSNLVFLVGEMRHISNSIADDFVEIYKAADSEEPKIFDVEDTVQKKVETALTPHPLPLRLHARQVVNSCLVERRRSRGMREKRREISGNVVKTGTRQSHL